MIVEERRWCFRCEFEIVGSPPKLANEVDGVVTCDHCRGAYVSRRIGGYLFDFIFVVVLGVLMGVCWGWIDPWVNGQFEDVLYYFMLAGVFLCIFGRDCVGGRSVGKRMVGLRVVRHVDGEKAGFFRLFGRHCFGFGGFVLLSVLGIVSGAGDVFAVWIWLYVIGYHGQKLVLTLIGRRHFSDWLMGTRVEWWAERDKLKGGVCGGCGYDLRGNVSGDCSECGLVLSEANLVWLKGVGGECDE